MMERLFTAPVTITRLGSDPCGMARPSHGVGDLAIAGRRGGVGDLIAGSGGDAGLDDLAGVVVFRRSRGGEVYETGTITMEMDMDTTTAATWQIPVPIFTIIAVSLPEMVSTRLNRQGRQGREGDYGHAYNSRTGQLAAGQRARVQSVSGSLWHPASKLGLAQHNFSANFSGANHRGILANGNGLIAGSRQMSPPRLWAWSAPTQANSGVRARGYSPSFQGQNSGSLGPRFEGMNRNSQNHTFGGSRGGNGLNASPRSGGWFHSIGGFFHGGSGGFHGGGGGSGHGGGGGHR